MADDLKKETRAALTIRLPPSILEKLKLESKRRALSQSGFVEMLMAGDFNAAESNIDDRVLEVAAKACVAALDLVKDKNGDPAAMKRAIASLEDFMILR